MYHIKRPYAFPYRASGRDKNTYYTIIVIVKSITQISELPRDKASVPIPRDVRCRDEVIVMRQGYLCLAMPLEYAISGFRPLTDLEY